MPRSLVVNNAVVLQDDFTEIPFSIRIDEEGLIETVLNRNLNVEYDSGAMVIDARRMSIWPGAIDIHVHERYPGGAHKETPETCWQSAVSGGVTMIGKMPNTMPTITDERTLADVQEATDGAGQQAMIHVGAATDNLELMPKLLREPMVFGAKLYLAPSTGTLYLAERKIIERHMTAIADAGKVTLIHSEENRILQRNQQRHQRVKDHCCAAGCHSKIRSKLAELVGVQRDVAIVKALGIRTPVIFCHLCNHASVMVIDRARQEGWTNIYAFTTPHHLFLTEELLSRPDGTRFQMNPAIHDPSNAHELWRDVLEGRIHGLETDHAPHTPEEKKRPFGFDHKVCAPSGVTGLETLRPTLYHRVTMRELKPSLLRELTSEAPARIFSLKTRGRLDVGMRGDFTLVDHRASWKVDRTFTKAADNPFMGEVFLGARTMMTIVGGNLEYERKEVGNA